MPKPPAMLSFHALAGRRASSLLTAMLCIVVVAMSLACLLRRVSSRSMSAHRSSAWAEALTTAEAAADMTTADLSALLPEVRLNQQTGTGSGVSQLPSAVVAALGVTSSGLSLAQGNTVTYTPAPLTHGGEGAGRQDATVSIEVVLLSQLLNGGLLSVQGVTGVLADPLTALNGSDLQLIRLRARGSVGVPGLNRADPDKLDGALRRQNLVWDRTAGGRVATPTVTREIDALLKPVLPFQSAVTSVARVNASSTGAVFDSFNSLDPLASTSGRYDLTKRLRNGDVNVGNNDATLPGTIYGDARSNGGNIAKTARITGKVDNAFLQPLPLIKTPTWTSSALPIPLLGVSTLAAGTLVAPKRYKYDDVNGTLHITRGLPATNTNVEIWITGDLTGRLILDSGVTAKIYIEGSVPLDAGSLNNTSERAANLQIYGLRRSGGSDTAVIQLALGDVCAAIYAPTHAVKLTGTGDFQGAITCASFRSTDPVHVHFDEALILNVGPILRYAMTSWMERRF